MIYSPPFAIIYSIYHLLQIVAFGSQEFSWFWQTVVNWNFLILWSSSWFATPRHKVSSLKSDERPSSGFIFKMKFGKAIAQFRQSVVTRGYFFNFSFSCASNMCFQSLRFSISRKCWRIYHLIPRRLRDKTNKRDTCLLLKPEFRPVEFPSSHQDDERASLQHLFQKKTYLFPKLFTTSNLT